jgi:1-acyl-sn-glycerol-3-phosphate acyltransferase
MANNKMIMYRIFRTVLGPIYRFWYHPTVIGKENIPEDGSFLIVGNHVHIMDQCNIIGSTKRRIHYMAKKEYFDHKYKEGKFPWFFKSAGCIPVDRTKKDTEAVESAMEVLQEGHAIGLFPEGTRNGLKEARAKEIYDHYVKDGSFEEFYKIVKNNKTSFVDYLEELYKNKKISKRDFLINLGNANRYLLELIDKKVIKEKDYYDHILLPFKFGAVSMANKTDSLLVPYAITGDYKFRSKNLVVRIGKPFKASDDLAKANEKLRKTILDLMKKNMKNK